MEKSSRIIVKKNHAQAHIYNYNDSEKKGAYHCQSRCLPVYTKVNCQDVIIWQKKQAGKQNQVAIRQLKGYKNLYVYYRAVKSKLEKIFIGTSTGNNPYVDIVSGKAVSFVGNIKSIIIAGDKVNIFSGIIQINTEKGDKTYKRNRLEDISKLATINELKKYAKHIAFQLTEWHKPQLLKLTSFENLQKKHTIQNSKKNWLNRLGEDKHSLVQELAEFDVIWIMARLVGYQIYAATLGSEFIEIIIYNKLPDKIKLLAESLSNKLGMKIATTKNGWSLLGTYIAINENI